MKSEMAVMKRNSEVHSIGNTDKIERYDWKLVDRPGELRWLNKHVLHIDDQYQRDANEAKIKALAREWSWLACGALLVAERDGVYFAFDGQHRWMAAMRRSDISDLPCVVFRTKGSKEEAEAFLRANKNRKPLTGLAKYRAALTAGHKAALLVERLITEAGRRASNDSSGGTVRALSLMMLHAEKQPLVLIRAWPIITEVCVGHSLHERIIDGLLYIENNLPDGQSLADKEWKRRLMRVGYAGLLSAANRFAVAYSRGGAKVWALGMVEEMNKGCRIHIALTGDHE